MITKIEKFGAEWCGPCKVMDKTLQQITDIEIVKYDVDDYEDLANEKRIKSVPTLIFYNEDNEVDRLIGAVPFETINKVIEKWKNQ